MLVALMFARLSAAAGVGCAPSSVTTIHDSIRLQRYGGGGAFDLENQVPVLSVVSVSVPSRNNRYCTAEKIYIFILCTRTYERLSDMIPEFLLLLNDAPVRRQNLFFLSTMFVFLIFFFCLYTFCFSFFSRLYSRSGLFESHIPVE